MNIRQVGYLSGLVLCVVLTILFYVPAPTREELERCNVQSIRYDQHVGRKRGGSVGSVQSLVAMEVRRRLMKSMRMGGNASPQAPPSWPHIVYPKSKQALQKSQHEHEPLRQVLSGNKKPLTWWRRFLLEGSFRGKVLYMHGPWQTSDSQYQNGKEPSTCFNMFLWVGVIIPFALIVAGVVMCFMGKNSLGDILVVVGAFFLILQPAMSICGLNSGKDVWCNNKWKDCFRITFGYTKGSGTPIGVVGMHVVRFIVHSALFAFAILCLVGLFDDAEEDSPKQEAAENKPDVEAPPAAKPNENKDADNDAVADNA